MIDCLIVGFNDLNFGDYVSTIRSMGLDSGAYRDLRLAFIEYDNKPQRSMDILNHFYFQGREGIYKKFHNADFLWPVILYLGTYLARRGFIFDYVNLFHLEKDKLSHLLLKNDVLTIAITTTLYVSVHPIMEIISFIREHNETAKIVLGGPYIHNQARALTSEALQSLLKYIGADFYVISQEGEFALANIIQALKLDSGFNHIANIAYKEAEEYVLTPSAPELNPLEGNMVDYRLFPKDEIGEFVSIRTAKSCPFACAYCGFPQRAGKYRYLSVDLVEKELNAVRDVGTVTTVTFLDDTFNVPKDRFKAILRMVIKNRYEFNWNCFYRSDHGDQETIDLMKQAGCEGVFLGIESGSDAMLHRMNKTARRKDYLKSVPLLKQAGIVTHGNLIIGFPGETEETVQETIDLIEQAQPDTFRAQLWYCDPMTPIWNRRDEYGIRGSAFNWSHRTMNYQTACNLVDELFLSIENSIWLPQNGFEQWSIFYLQRKGMTLEQIKVFLKYFNAVIKEKLLVPQQDCLKADLLGGLKRSCQFDAPAPPTEQPIQVLAGTRYVAARQFWEGEFSTEFRPARTSAPYGESAARREGYATVPCPVEELVWERIRPEPTGDLSEVILAAYSLLLSWLNGREETVVVSVTHDGEKPSLLPLRLQPSSELTFKEFTRRVQRKVSEARQHQIYASYILTDPWRSTPPAQSGLIFDVGYAFGRVSKESLAGELEEALKTHPLLSPRLGLILEAVQCGDRVDLRFRYDANQFEQETVQAWSAYLTDIFRTVCEDPQVSIQKVISVNEGQRQRSAIEADANELFNF